jgi:hypothetical protein
VSRAKYVFRAKPFKLPKGKKPYTQGEKIYFALRHMVVGLDAAYAGIQYIEQLIADNKKESDPF